MTKTVPRFKPNRESVALFENSNAIESFNKQSGSEEHKNKILTKICKSLIENYKKRLVSVKVNNGDSTKY